MLAGRKDVLERFDVTLSRLEAGRADVAPMITGPRGSGKTVLLNELVAGAQRRGWFTASDEVIPETPLSSLIAIQAHEVLLQMSRKHRVADRVQQALGVLKAFTAVSALGISISIDANAVAGADTGIFSRDLRHLFVEIGEVAREQSVGVAFALDEVHALGGEEFDDLYSGLHQTVQRQLPIAFIGAGLFPSWQHSGTQRGDPSHTSSYPARMDATTYVRLEPLDAEESAHALADPARTEDVEYTGEALDAAVAFCEGNVWALQLIGATAWELAERSPIDLQAVKAATTRIMRQWAGTYFPRLLRFCSKDEIRLLKGIATLDVEVAEFDSVQRLVSITGVRDGFDALRSLALRDLITLDYTDLILHGASFRVSFSVPQLGAYIRALGDHFGLMKW